LQVAEGVNHNQQKQDFVEEILLDMEVYKILLKTIQEFHEDIQLEFGLEIEDTFTIHELYWLYSLVVSGPE